MPLKRLERLLGRGLGRLARRRKNSRRLARQRWPSEVGIAWLQRFVLVPCLPRLPCLLQSLLHFLRSLHQLFGSGNLRRFLGRCGVGRVRRLLLVVRLFRSRLHRRRSHRSRLHRRRSHRSRLPRSGASEGCALGHEDDFLHSSRIVRFAQYHVVELRSVQQAGEHVLGIAWPQIGNYAFALRARRQLQRGPGLGLHGVQHLQKGRILRSDPQLSVLVGNLRRRRWLLLKRGRRRCSLRWRGWGSDFLRFGLPFGRRRR